MAPSYEPSLNTVPFDDCDFSNVGVSRFCSFSQKIPLPMTERFVTQVSILSTRFGQKLRT
jgi:hypothetical protein